MAEIIPPLNNQRTLSRMTSGEKRVAQRLEFGQNTVLHRLSHTLKLTETGKDKTTAWNT